MSKSIAPGGTELFRMLCYRWYSIHVTGSRDTARESTEWQELALGTVLRRLVGAKLILARLLAQCTGTTGKH